MTDQSRAGDAPSRAGSGREAITPLDEAVGESVAERARREEADPLVEELERAARAAEAATGQQREGADLAPAGDEELPAGPVDPSDEAAAALEFLADPDADYTLLVDPSSVADPDRVFSAEQLGSFVLADPDPSGGLGEPTWSDLEEDLVATAWDPLGDESAEEAAVHLTQPPPWREDPERGDGR